MLKNILSVTLLVSMVTLLSGCNMLGGSIFSSNNKNSSISSTNSSDIVLRCENDNLKGCRSNSAIQYYSIGLAYESGEKVSKDYSIAREWYKKADAKGNINSTTNLASMYVRGDGGEKNYKEAFRLYSNAAGRGDSVAMLDLGILYENGAGVDKNVDKAIYWYRRSASLNNIDAEKKLGDFYWNQDKKSESYQWYLLAAKNGDPEAQFTVGNLLENGNGIKTNKKHAFYWHLRSAQQGYKDAECHVGSMYASGIGTTRNKQKSKYWINKCNN